MTQIKPGQRAFRMRLQHIADAVELGQLSEKIVARGKNHLGDIRHPHDQGAIRIQLLQRYDLEIPIEVLRLVLRLA